MRVACLALVVATGCGARAGAAPAAAAEAPASSPPPAAPTSGERPPAPTSPPTFVLRTASTRYDFRFDMNEDCPGEAAASMGCAGPAVLHVLRKAGGRGPGGPASNDGAEVQRFELDEVWIAFDADGTPRVNSAGLYDVQGTVNVDDFDFDGREDFAVQVDQSGPYGGPTFAVFLHAAGEERFTRSEPLSRLTAETLGFFRVDAARRRLVTLQKSGCCFHVTEEHAVVGGEPLVLARFTEDATAGDGFAVVTEERLVGGRWRKTKRRVAAQP